MQPLGLAFRTFRKTVAKVVIILIIIGALLFIKINQPATLAIYVVPSSSTVKIGQETYQNGTYKVPPGNFIATISHDELETKEIAVELKSGQETKLETYLVGPNQNFDWYTKNPDDLNMLASIKDAAVEAFLQENNSYATLERKLPYTYEEYSKDYNKHTWFIIKKTPGENCDYFCLTIDDKTGGNYDLAISELTKLGFNVDKCKIIYEYSTVNNPVMTGFSHDGR